MLLYSAIRTFRSERGIAAFAAPEAISKANSIKRVLGIPGLTLPDGGKIE